MLKYADKYQEEITGKARKNDSLGLVTNRYYLKVLYGWDDQTKFTFFNKYYKSVLIESGDTLWSIAAKYKAAGMNTSSLVEEIKRMNGLSNDQIIAGNYLIIPYYQPKTCLNMHS